MMGIANLYFRSIPCSCTVWNAKTFTPHCLFRSEIADDRKDGARLQRYGRSSIAAHCCPNAIFASFRFFHIAPHGQSFPRTASVAVHCHHRIQFPSPQTNRVPDVAVKAESVDLLAEAEAADVAAAAVAAGGINDGVLRAGRVEETCCRPSAISYQPGVPCKRGFFGQWPRWPPILTGLPPTVRPAAVALPAAKASIGGGRGYW